MSVPAEHINSHWTLAELLEGIADAPAIVITDITSDSRRVTPGCVFFACAGASHHGLDFCKRAMDAGAAAVVFDSDTATSAPSIADLPLIPVAGLKARLGSIADRFFAEPSSDLRIVGVTGTNGKSTVAWLIAQSYAALGQRCAYAGTLGYGLDEVCNDDDMTSPDVIEIHRRLRIFCDEGATHAAIEVSSHALDQGRVDAVRFAATLFTNLSRDHLDYHSDMQAYGEAKARLFTQHAADLRVVNLDSEFGTELASRCREDVVTVSTNFDRVANGRPFVFVRSVVAHERGSEIRLQSSWGEGGFQLALPGDFNVANAVMVLALLLADGVELDKACGAMSCVEAPPGRMQRVPAEHGPSVFVDYAHTPAALEVALRALKAHCRGKLWCVFGCGGDRDAGKRPLMGRIAERLADCVVITNDNPRTEAPGEIIEQIVAGLQHADRAQVIEDRAAAIGWAATNAAARDIVLIAGKGHENYQIIGTERLDFSDFGVAAATLEAAEGRA